ncbi:MAG: GNAT family N-acetyltransferase [Acidimicrobiales bacterium]
MRVREAHPADVTAIAVLANADRAPGIARCRPEDVVEAMAGHSAIDNWFWQRLGKITTLVAEHDGQIRGAGSISIGVTDMDSGSAGDRWLLWLHATEDACVLNALLEVLFRVGDDTAPVHAFAFATPLATGLEALPVGTRPVTDAALGSLGLAGVPKWTMMRTKAGTTPPTLGYLTRHGETEASTHICLDLGEELVGEADITMTDATTGVLWWLFVPDEHRGRGLGRELLRAARSVLEDGGARQVVLFVDDDDPVERDRAPALALYGAEGFKVVDRLAIYEGVPHLDLTNIVSHRGHGTPACYASGCRCSLCATSWRTCRRYQSERRAFRLDLDSNAAPRGRPSTYTNWGCRCKQCTASHARSPVTAWQSVAEQAIAAKPFEHGPEDNIVDGDASRDEGQQLEKAGGGRAWDPIKKIRTTTCLPDVTP